MPLPSSGTYGYRLYQDRVHDAYLGERSGGVLDDRCYRAIGPYTASVDVSSDGTRQESGDWSAAGLLVAYATEAGQWPPSMQGNVL